MDANRRAVLVGGLAAAASVAAGGGTASAAETGSGRAAAPMPAGLDGELRFDRATRAAAADDFGHLVHRTPVGVLRPGSDEDVASTIRWARLLRGTVAPQGQSHSVWGRSQTRDGIVVDMSALRSVREVRGDRVVVDAGAKWSEVLAATLPAGLTPPVLTDYLELSVGGTLVVGGVGGTTSRFGVQSDTVLEMDVVTGRGQKLTCSAHRNPDLFDAVRGGLGQVAVITRATLRLVAAPESVRRFLLYYPDLASMLTDARALAGGDPSDERFDVVQGAILAPPSGGWVYRLDTARYFTGTAPDDATLLAGLHDDPDRRQPSTTGYFDYLNRLAALEGALRGNGQWFYPHPWLTTFLGDSHVQAVVADELARLHPPTDLGQFGQVVLSPIRRTAITSPLLRLPTDNLCFAFNLVRIPTTDNPDTATTLANANKTVYQRVTTAGGTLYPVSAFPMTHTDWRHHFGPTYHHLTNAKHRYDPANVLTPGYEVF